MRSTLGFLRTRSSAATAPRATRIPITIKGMKVLLVMTGDPGVAMLNFLLIVISPLSVLKVG